MSYFNVEVWVELDDSGRVVNTSLTKETEKYVPVTAKFLKPGWLLTQRLSSESLNVNTGMLDPYALLTNRVKYLLKELTLPDEMSSKLSNNGNPVLGVAYGDNVEALQNMDELLGNDGIQTEVLDTLLHALNMAWIAKKDSNDASVETNADAVSPAVVTVNGTDSAVEDATVTVS